MGQTLGSTELHTTRGKRITLAQGEIPTLVWVTPTCSTCDQLLPAVKAIARTESHRMRTILVSLGNLESTLMYVDQHDVDFPAVSGPEMRDDLNISVTPYAALVDGEGTVLAAGLVNHLDHLESLLASPRSMDGEGAQALSLSGDLSKDSVDMTLS